VQLAICWKTRRIHPILVINFDGSDNSVVCGMTRATPENQQETVNRDPQRPYASHLASKRDEEMVRTLRRRREAGRNDRSANHAWLVGNRPSEIPCRVSNDLPPERVTSLANPANNGEPLTRSYEREIPWEVEGRHEPFDPVTTEAKAKMVFLPPRQIYGDHKTPAL
jgi:hypothetical protein